MLRRALVSVSILTAQARLIHEYKFEQSPLSESFRAHAQSTSSEASPMESFVTVGVENVRVTKLANGVRVISRDMGGPMVSIGAYVLAGPVYDPVGLPGVGAMMHHALAMSNFRNTLTELDHSIRRAGAAKSHFELYKHYIGIRVSCRGDKWRNTNTNQYTTGTRPSGKSVEQQHTINLIQDNIFACIAAPRFDEADIESFRDTIDKQLKELKWKHPAEYAKQVLETVAFYSQPLGNPRYVLKNGNSHITRQVLMDQYHRFIIPSHVCIAGVNVDHDALIAEYENTPLLHTESAPHYAQVLASTATVKKPNGLSEMQQYTGGERQDHEERANDMGTKPDMDTESICAVGWLAFGRHHVQLRDYAGSLVTKAFLDSLLLDGMRYNKEETHIHEGVCAFYNPYQTAGLMGITVTAEPPHASKMVMDAVKLLKENRSPSEKAIDAAKHGASVRFLNEHTDNICNYCNFLGTSLPLDAERTTAISIEDVLESIRAVRSIDVKKVLDQMFSHPASLYGHGEMLGFPSMRQMGL